VLRDTAAQTASAIMRPKALSADGRTRCFELGGLVAATMLL
jgi:hypothetical protein